MKSISILLFSLVLCATGRAQFLTGEDSLTAGLNPTAKNVILSGYGEANYTYDQNFQVAQFNLARAVLFVGYRFNSKITLLSEIEIEGAKVSSSGGEISVEQCVIKFDLNRNNYIMAGLFIPRIGIMNENHLPTTFNGVNRPFVETRVIPSTWRELGIGYYGSSNAIPGLNWSLGLVNGLNSSGIAGSTGLVNARFEGQKATATNLAVTGSILYYFGDFRLQASGYYGGTVGLSPREADSLGLNYGTFGTPVGLTEIDCQYQKNGWAVKALATFCAIPDAQQLNTAYANNAANTMYGYYLEVGYNILQKSKYKNKILNIYSRYEKFDLMATVPENGIKDDQFNQQYLVTGLAYFPIRAIAIKADWIHLVTGEANPDLIFNPSPNAPPYMPVNNFYQLGLAYSF